MGEDQNVNNSYHNTEQQQEQHHVNGNGNGSHIEVVRSEDPTTWNLLELPRPVNPNDNVVEMAHVSDV